MNDSPSVLMVAAENDALPGFKVGGVADVMRDLPVALIKAGFEVQSVIPSYGRLAKLGKLETLQSVELEFSGRLECVSVYKQLGKKNQPDIFIFDSPLFSPQGPRVYCHDGSDNPFATDATKFAFFCAAVAEALNQGVLPRPDFLHCHDWHTSFLLILLRYAPQYVSLSDIRTVFSIHNLAMQGVRPMRDNDSSFESWFPSLVPDLRNISDPVAPHCVNPMRAGIILADKVHTVSPTYAQEILAKSDHEKGIYGGEGLEADLVKRFEQKDLVGILNGCEYPRAKAQTSASLRSLAKLLKLAVDMAAAKNKSLLTAHWLAEKRIEHWAAKKKPGMLLSSVGRITDQKARLFVTELKSGQTALSVMLGKLGTKGTFIMVGTGDPDIEQALVEESAKHTNFIFINGFAAEAAEALYREGDLFVMPSSFEPCGISQLLAMRAGQPCLVNRVGGLRDTIIPNRTGFAFEGADVIAQAEAMVAMFEEALRVYTTSPEIWAGICKSAKKARFTWEKSVEAYRSELYSN